MVKSKLLSMRVKGDYALFTNSAFKSEPYSYDVITPSAAVGLFKSVYWHPDLEYEITNIKVLNPINRIQIIKNGIKSVATKQKDHIDVQNDRVQRNHSMLIDVDYILTGYIYTYNDKFENPRNEITKAVDIFERRMNRHETFKSPFLGKRECVAYIKPISNDDPQPINETKSLSMLYKILYGDKNEAVFMDVNMINGEIDITKAEKYVKRIV